MSGCCGGLTAGVALTGVCFLFLLSSSSDESESDDESFFLLFARLAGGGMAVFLTTDAPLATTDAVYKLENDQKCNRTFGWC